MAKKPAINRYVHKVVTISGVQLSISEFASLLGLSDSDARGLLVVREKKVHDQIYGLLKTGRWREATEEQRHLRSLLARASTGRGYTVDPLLTGNPKTTNLGLEMGMTIGTRTVIGLEKGKRGRTIATVACPKGHELRLEGSKAVLLKESECRECRHQDFTGTVWSMLTVIADVDVVPGKRRRLLVRCACGTEKTIEAQRLTGGRTKSCGCLKKKKQVTADVAPIDVSAFRAACETIVQQVLGSLDRYPQTRAVPVGVVP